MKNRYVARFAVFIIDVLLFSCRIEVKGREEIKDILKSGKYIYASWHGRLILFFLLARGNNIAVMTSNSKDGTIAAAMQQTAGCAIFRGSTGKGGGTALQKMSRYMKKNNKPAMLSVDGPEVLFLKQNQE